MKMGRAICSLVLLVVLTGCAIPNNDAALEPNIDSITKQLDAAYEEIAVLTQLLAEHEESITSQEELYLHYSEKDMSKAILLTGDTNYNTTELYTYPYCNSDKYSFRTASGQMVEVIAKCAISANVEMGETWYLVRLFSSMPPPSSNVGWIQAKYLTEYTQTNYLDIIYPVRIRDDAIVYIDQDCSVEKAYFNDSNEYYTVLYEAPNGNIKLKSSSWIFWVNHEDIIYPDP